MCGIALVGLSSAASAQTPVSGLQAVSRQGQVFITFSEVPGSSLTYQVSRSAQPITSLAGLTPLAVLPQGSGVNKYTGTNFIIADLGAPLPNGTGLVVLTSTQTGAFYYAVTNSSSSALVPGANVTSAPVSEVVWATPGAVQIRPTYTDAAGNRVREYFAWEDPTTWHPCGY